MTHDVLPEKSVGRGDTVWGLYQQDIPGIMTWPAEAKDRLMHKWRDANPGKDEIFHEKEINCNIAILLNVIQLSKTYLWRFLKIAIGNA